MSAHIETASFQRPLISLGRRLRSLLGEGAVIAALIFVGMLLLYMVLQPRAASVGQLEDQLANSLPLILAAVGGTFVVLTRGFDLSVAGVISLTNVLVASFTPDGPAGLLWAVVMVSAAGMCVGAVNGFLVAFLRLPPIACTLATMIITGGVALLLMNAPGGYVPYEVSELFFSHIGPLPISLLTVLLVWALWALLKRTDWGVGLYAVGADETASQLAGVATTRVKFFAYCVAGAFYGLAGLALCGISASGDPNGGANFLLPIFAAIAIGGVSFAGGRGGVVGAMLGALIIMLVQKFLFSLGVSSFYTGIGQGALMIVAALIGVLSGHFARSRAE
ncbi:ABC transporter permease [Aminobacter sp. MSH1]|uniref:ABC transporter permease n=1 Tax=Aminobacter sp. MSH1 TaxID=374606 RepID=UPI000D39EC62|nr:ABC transporter permease [Aminobacter sp. MSH1]